MNAEIPALREALRQTAQRRSRRRRTTRFALPAFAVTAIALVVFVSAARRPEREVPAGPVAVIPQVLRPPLLSAADAERAGAAVGVTRVERAWSTPELGGDVLLYRDARSAWCLYVPDPSGGGGGSCGDQAAFASRGLNVSVGGTMIDVAPDGSAALSLALPDGTRQTLTPGAGGIVALAGTPDGAVVTLAGGLRFRVDNPPMRQVQCPDGRSYEQPATALSSNPCGPPASGSPAAGEWHPSAGS
jgi:hypothetical protein